MRAQAHEDEEEDTPEEDEARNLLLPPAASRYSGGGGGGGGVSGGSGGKRAGLLYSAPATFPAYSSSAVGAAAAACAAAGAAPTAPRLCRPSAFVVDLSMLIRVFFVRGLFTERRWLFPLLLAVTAVGYEVAAATILNVIAEFYLAISSMDTPLFLQASGGGGRGCSTAARAGCRRACMALQQCQNSSLFSASAAVSRFKPDVPCRVCESKPTCTQAHPGRPSRCVFNSSGGLP